MGTAMGVGNSPVFLHFAGGGSPPAAPTGLTAVQNGADVDLAWTNNAVGDGIKIYRSTDGVVFVEIGDIAANSVAYTDLAPGSGFYAYYVATYNASGESASDVAEVAVFLLRDEFTTPETAPLASPRAAEPVGMENITDPTNRLSIGSSQLVASGGGTTLFEAFVETAVSYSHVSGLAVFVKSSVYTRIGIFIGRNNMKLVTTANFNAASNINAQSTLLIARDTQQGSNMLVGIAMAGYFGIVKSSNGRMHYLVDGLLAWVSRYADTTQWYYYINPVGTTDIFEADDFTVARLGDPFQDNFALSTHQAVAPISGDVASGAGNCIVYLDWTAATGGVATLRGRRVDDDNCIRADFSQASGNVRLYKRVAGVDTELGGAVVQTFINGTTYRLALWMNGVTLHTAVDDTRKNSQAESYNATETGTKVAITAGAIANYEVYPIDLSAAAIAEIDRFLA